MKEGCQVSKGNLAQSNEVCCHNRSSCDHRLEPERTMLEKIQKMIVVRSPTIRELLAEALGMYILMVRRRWAQVCVCAGWVSICSSNVQGQWFPTASSGLLRAACYSLVVPKVVLFSTSYWRGWHGLDRCPQPSGSCTGLGACPSTTDSPCKMRTACVQLPDGGAGAMSICETLWSHNPSL